MSKKRSFKNLFSKVRLIASIGAALFIVFVLAGFGMIAFADSTPHVRNRKNFTFNNEYCTGIALYNDYDFYGDNTKVNIDLAIASLGMAVSTWTKDNTSEKTVKNNFNNMDLFDDVVSYGYTGTTSLTTIGVVMAHREVFINNRETNNIMLVAVRSGGYVNEWMANTFVGESDNHTGFQYAAGVVEKQVVAYLEKHKIKFDGRLKLWIVGYSRGAAVANLVARDFDDECAWSANAGSMPAIYAYTFATPATTVSSAAKNSRYNNIHNIINPYDVVPKVPFAKWGFKRFGQDYFLPSELNDSSYYKTDATDIRNCYSSLSKNKPSGFYSLTVPMQQRSTELLVESLSDIISSRALYNYRDPSTRISYADLAEYAVSGLKARDYHDHSIVNKALKSSMLTGLLGVALANLTTKMNITRGSSVLEPAAAIVDDLVGMITTGFSARMANTVHIATAHCPTYYMSALKAKRTLYSSADKTGYCVVGGHCPVDIEIYDKDNTLVASVVNNEVVKDDLPIEIINDEKLIYVPNDAEFSVKITATDAGEMKYTVTECTPEGTELRRVIADDIELTNGQIFTGTIPVTQENEAIYQPETEDEPTEGETVTEPEEEPADVPLPEATVYTLTTNDTPVEIDQVLVQENLNTVPVDVTGESGGIVDAPKTATQGDKVTVNADALPGFEFDGWYDAAGQKITAITKKDYTFTADSANPVHMKAKFTPIHITALEITETSVDMDPDEEHPLGIKMTPEKNSEMYTATFTTTDNKVADIDDGGNITAVDFGTCSVKAKIGSFEKTIPVSVGTEINSNILFSGKNGVSSALVTLKSLSSPDKQYTSSVLLGQDGGALKTRVPKGSYELSVTKPGLLSYSDSSFSVPADSLPTTITLYPGDVTGDNAINAKDQAAMTDVFGAKSTDEKYSAAADFNEDAVINAADRSEIIKNFGKAGTVAE